MTWGLVREEGYMNSRRGQSVVEAAVAIAITLFVITALVGLGVAALRSATISKNRAMAASYAQEAMEAIRSIRDRSFSDFDNCKDSGTRYQLTQTDSQWGCTLGEENPLPNDPAGIFWRSFTSTENPADLNCNLGCYLVEVRVRWADSAGNHEVILDSYLTDWR